MNSGLTTSRRFVVAALLWAGAGRALAASVAGARDRWFTTDDDVRLHYLEAGHAEPGRTTLVFVPGWTMPAWIWSAQIEHFASEQRVLAFDPRGQGRSALAATGYDYRRRAADLAQLLAAAGAQDVVLVGWSLGVLECLQYMYDSAHDSAHGSGTASGRTSGTASGTASGAPTIRGLVLVDNSVGEGEPPRGGASTFLPRLRSKRRETVQAFVKGMFKRPQAQAWLDELTEAALRTPLPAAIALLSQGTPREFWRETLYALEQPVLYAYTPRLAQQGELAAARKPSIETHLFAEAGHALFVDEAATFNAALAAFVKRLPAPRAR